MATSQAYQSTNFIFSKMKEIVCRYDADAQIILFGSRARGDWNEESDWDFLILSNLAETNSVKEKIRKDVLNEIELVSFDVVSTLLYNKQVWADDYSVTNIYKNIETEGKIV